MQLRVAELVACSDLRIADGTLIGVANYPGCASRSEFAGTAAYGYCAVQEPVRLGRTPRPGDRPERRAARVHAVAANEKEYEPVRELTTAHPGCTLIADKGLWGREYREILALQAVALLTPDRTRTTDNLAREQRLAGLRLVIESTIANLKCQMRLEHHLARDSRRPRAADRQRLLALTIGMLLNALTGRPPRALVAYDGR